MTEGCWPPSFPFAASGMPIYLGPLHGQRVRIPKLGLPALEMVRLTSPHSQARLTSTGNGEAHQSAFPS
jgi:hypothetical protein